MAKKNRTGLHRKTCVQGKILCTHTRTYTHAHTHTCKCPQAHTHAHPGAPQFPNVQISIIMNVLQWLHLGMKRTKWCRPLLKRCHYITYTLTNHLSISEPYCRKTITLTIFILHGLNIWEISYTRMYWAITKLLTSSKAHTQQILQSLRQMNSLHIHIPLGVNQIG